MSDRSLRLLSIGLFVAVLGIPTTARAQYPLDVLHDFEGSFLSEGAEAPLILGRDGNLYGTTWDGGQQGQGTVFRMTRSGVITILHSFAGGVNGFRPAAALLEAADGNFYGTTTAEAGRGTVFAAIFRLSPAGEFSVLQYLNAPGAFSPLVQGPDGQLYGTASASVIGGTGLIFRLTVAGEFTVIHQFVVSSLSDGARPVGLTLGSDGNFYGTTISGGNPDANCAFSAVCGYGTVFRMTPSGILTTLHRFSAGGGGAYPQSLLTPGNDGNFYGTTTNGGAAGGGTIFRIAPAGTVTTLYAFPLNRFGSANPQTAPLASAADGSLYGVDANSDTVFRFSLQGAVTMLHTFHSPSEGARPLGVTQAADGLFYGATADGIGPAGSFGPGGVFAINPAGMTTMVYHFTSGVAGVVPSAPLVQASDGNFYGTTASGGPYNRGTIFRVTPAGQFSVIYNFTGGFDGGDARDLVQGRDGHLYGTTFFFGAFNEGVMFRVTLDGRFTVLHAFSHARDGGHPAGGLTLGTDGNFYGTIHPFSEPGNGTIYRATPSGDVTVLHVFTGGADGFVPDGHLIAASDGALYGIAAPIAFRITTAGVFQSLRRVDQPPSAARMLLAQGADGNLYGAPGCGGNFFRMSLSGDTLTELAETQT
jgi:uncharacterized repeat protein (TIGR03803 family)